MYGFRLFINNTEVDILEDFSLSLTSQINDIRNPEAKTTTYSKTVTLPATKVNRDLFGHIYELHSVVDTSGTVNFVPDFNPNLKADCIALFDGIEVFRGIAQMTEIRVRDNHEVVFDFVLLGQLVGLYKNIGDSYLIDLDFSEYNHDYTLTNIANSWSNSSGYVYPLIDYGFSTNLTNFNTNNLRPAIFVKQIIEKIFSNAGCTYDSDFFDSVFFQKLIIPFTGGNFKMTTADVVDRKFRASRVTSDQTATVSGSLTYSDIIFNNDSTAPNFDNSSQYNISTGEFTVATGLNGIFNITSFVELATLWVPDTSGIAMTTLKGTVVNISIVKEDASGNRTILNTLQRKMRATSLNPITTSLESDPDDNTFFVGGGNGNVYINSGAIYLTATDKIYVEAGYFYSNFSLNGGTENISTLTNAEKFQDSSGNVYDGTYTVKFKVGSYLFNEIANANYQEGQTINMNSVLPEKIKQKDFLNSIIKMFNLYLEQDKDVSNKFIIEPRDEYYYTSVGGTTLIDLSDKLDISQPFTQKPMGALDWLQYIFKYKEDSDYFNTQYKNKWGETYSERLVNVQNDFLKDIKTTDVIFSATPSVGSSTSDRIIPRILNIDLNGNISPVTANPRILIYDGLKDTNGEWYINFGGADTAYTQYPYAGMLDDAYNPTVSLDWEVPDEIFWTNIFATITYTNKNLYNQYWKKFIEEITDADSKIVAGYFDIRPYDYSQLDFRKIYYFEGEYFRLNKIYDYNPLSDGLTKLEFIKIKRGIETAFTLTEAENVFSEDLVPGFSSPDTTGDNIIAVGFESKISGKRNRVASSNDSYSVVGSGNMIGEWCENIIVNGDDNVVNGQSSGVTILGGDRNIVNGVNVTLINTSDATVTESNVTYSNGTKQTIPLKYVALLNQSGTDAPVATVLENTLGGAIVWSRDSAGYYIGTLSGEFTANKTVVRPPNIYNTDLFEDGGIPIYSGGSDSVNTVYVGTAKSIGGTTTLTDGMLSGGAFSIIEITIYPE